MWAIHVHSTRGGFDLKACSCGEFKSCIGKIHLLCFASASSAFEEPMNWLAHIERMLARYVTFRFSCDLSVVACAYRFDRLVFQSK